MVDYCNVLLRKTKSKAHVLIGQNRTLSYSRKCWVTFVCSSSWVEAQQLPRHHLRPLVCEEILFSGLWRNTFFWSVTKSYFLWREKKNNFFWTWFFWHRAIEVFEHMYQKLSAYIIHTQIYCLCCRLLQKFSSYIYVPIYSICFRLLNKVTLLVAT